MAQTALSAKLIARLNNMGWQAKAALLGTRLSEAATKDGAETLSNKTLSEPEIINSFAAHDYAAGAADWTLSAAEGKKKYLIVTNANGAVNAIIPAGKNFKEYVIVNTSGQELTVKCPSGTGIVVASTKTAVLYFDGTNFKRLTPDT